MNKRQTFLPGPLHCWERESKPAQEPKRFARRAGPSAPQIGRVAEIRTYQARTAVEALINV